MAQTSLILFVSNGGISFAFVNALFLELWYTYTCAVIWLGMLLYSYSAV